MSEKSAGDLVEDVTVTTGQWAEGIFYATAITLPIIILIGISVGLVMGITRFSVRKMETSFSVGGNQ